MASSGHTNLEELVSLLRAEIPEGRQTLLDTQSNLEKVADYCASNYLNVSSYLFSISISNSFSNLFPFSAVSRQAGRL